MSLLRDDCKVNCVFCFLKADQNADFVVMMKKMTLAKSLKNTWLVLFAEITVSDKECLILMKIRTSFIMLISRLF